MTPLSVVLGLHAGLHGHTASAAVARDPMAVLRLLQHAGVPLTADVQSAAVLHGCLDGIDDIGRLRMMLRAIDRVCGARVARMVVALREPFTAIAHISESPMPLLLKRATGARWDIPLLAIALAAHIVRGRGPADAFAPLCPPMHSPYAGGYLRLLGMAEEATTCAGASTRTPLTPRRPSLQSTPGLSRWSTAGDDRPA
ncbi:MAG: hypothetical protein G01um101425_952 [Candidatus Peregrinibacteria bacterium Gr01-1014_25]|nr:MAG: hypothetical protein G01um101425_952 [Candidatus Peregrinibacteria bacterium Gr01-1014_25]